MQETKNITIKFDGKGITPGEIGRELLSLLNACYDLAECHGGNISISEIRDNCISIKAIAAPAISAAMLFSPPDCGNSEKGNAAIRCINSFNARHSSTVSIIDENGREVALFGGEKGNIPEIPNENPSTWTVRRLVYGELVDIGGTTPNIHLKVDGQEKNLLLQIDKETARNIAGRLYTEIGVMAEVTMEGRNITGGKVLHVTNYNPEDFESWHRNAMPVLGKAFANVDADSFIREMRG